MTVIAAARLDEGIVRWLKQVLTDQACGLEFEEVEDLEKALGGAGAAPADLVVLDGEEGLKCWEALAARSGAETPLPPAVVVDGPGSGRLAIQTAEGPVRVVLHSDRPGVEQLLRCAVAVGRAQTEAWRKGERAVREAELRERRRFIDGVTSKLTHDINNPLQAITLANRSLVRKYGRSRQNEAISECLRKIQSAIDVVARMKGIEE
ncbi:MAG TPA: hypothetical protein ENJ37_01080 [Deltaproteobacteria bacterium]|nr:hypothetical protein [Deltaproteobacteria bacterium]